MAGLAPRELWKNRKKKRESMGKGLELLREEGDSEKGPNERGKSKKEVMKRGVTRKTRGSGGGRQVTKVFLNGEPCERVAESQPKRTVPGEGKGGGEVGMEGQFALHGAT